MTRAEFSRPSTGPRYFRSPPGEPPVLVDPRRWGALIGLVGGLVFVFSYGPALGSAAFVAAAVLAVGLTVDALVHLYLRPVSLGTFREPTRAALLVYAGCVVGELAAISLGSRWLSGLDRTDLRPALIAAVVGLHFLPFAWAFGERMFSRLGLALLVLGALGLVLGWTWAPLAAGAAAVVSGVVMIGLLVAYSRGRFRSRTR